MEWNDEIPLTSEQICEALVRYVETTGSEIFEKNFERDGKTLCSVLMFYLYYNKGSCNQGDHDSGLESFMTLAEALERESELRLGTNWIDSPETMIIEGMLVSSNGERVRAPFTITNILLPIKSTGWNFDKGS